MIISKLVIQYESKGAEKAEKADGKVRTSLKKTGKTAKKDETVVQRWMSAHKTALVAIGAAASGLLAGIIKSTPTLTAELGSIRLAFSMLAMEVGQLLVPAFIKMEEWSWKLSEGFANLSTPVKNAISAMVIVLFVSVALIVGIALLAAALTALGVSATVLAVVAIGVILVGALVWAYEKFGLLGAAVALVLFPFWPFIAVIYLLVKALGGVTKIMDFFKRHIIWLKIAVALVLLPFWPFIFVLTRLERRFGLISKSIKLLRKGLKGLASMVKNVIGWIVDAFHKLTGDGALQSGKDFASNFAKGLGDIEDKVEKAFGKVEKVFSFDIRSNDMMAMKWGMDFAKYMTKGISAGFGGVGGTQMAGVAPPPATTGGGGVNITIEQGAISMTGMASGTQIDLDRLAEKLYLKMRDRVGARF